jgi:hypothetical protein
MLVTAIVRPGTYETTKASKDAARRVVDIATAVVEHLTPPIPSQPPTTTATSTPPTTDAERITSLESRVQELEDNHATLSSQFLSLAQQFITQGESYKLLLKTNTSLVADSAANKREIDRLDRLVAQLRTDKPSQGGVVILDESCRSDELAKKRGEDTDDDPSCHTPTVGGIAGA